MTQDAGIEGGGNPQGQPAQGQPQQTPQQNGGQNGGRPYDQYLQRIPETLRGTVEPVFQEWDRNTTQRFQELQGQISGYEPYQQYFDTYEPEAVGQAIQLAEALSNEQSARQVLDQLAAALNVQIVDGNGQPQGQNGVNGFDDSEPDFFADPRFQQLQEGMGTIAQQLQQQQQQQQEAQVYAETEREWTELRDANTNLFTNPDGSPNEDAEEAVFAFALANNGDLAKAVSQYQKVVGAQAAIQNSPGQNAPLVGGGAQNTMPSGQIDMAKLSSEQRKQLAVQALQRANREG